MSTLFWIWMAAAVVFLIIELTTPTLVFVCFTIGAAAAGVLNYFYPESYPWQIAIFALVSIALIPLTKKFAGKISKEAPETSNVDRMINQIAIVTKEIDPDEPGQVRYQGEVWRAAATEIITIDEKVTITGITGTTVTVERINN